MILLQYLLTFLQRAYDQITHDVVLQNQHFFCLIELFRRRRHLATHHGVFDLAHLRCISNADIHAPMNVLPLQNDTGRAIRLTILSQG
jgi:1-deoxy-D-xylulose-5-phosphate synthase